MRDNIEVDGLVLPVIGTAALIADKRAAGRPKDLLDLSLLEHARARRPRTKTRR